MRGKHSAKPEEVRGRIERMFPDQAKLELFAREMVDGWDSHGDEVEGNVGLKPQVGTG
jgi:site-specific DNA-methyltransferase (adenine-specific)